MNKTVKRRSTSVDLADLWALTKPRQTALLLFTALCAYVLSEGLPVDALEALAMAVGLLFSISGCTALNMFLDRDIDGSMSRTAGRPLPSGAMRPAAALLFGSLLSVVGLTLSFALHRPFGLVVASGFIIDLLVYTAWLKRRTPVSIIFGGVSGGIPVLAGRVFALGQVDTVGLLLAGSVLLWIPSHVLTLAIRYAADYKGAGVPMWPNIHGLRATRFFIAASNVLNSGILMVAGLLLHINTLALLSLVVLSIAMIVLSTREIIVPTERQNWLLFKAASLYMLASSLILTLGTLL